MPISLVGFDGKRPQIECMFPQRPILEVGCGDNPIKEDTPDILTKLVDYRLDVSAFPCVTLRGNTVHLPFRDNSIGAIVCQHVIEHHTHCSFGHEPSYGTLLQFLSECFRVLKPGGYFESICPNFAYISKAYVSTGYGNVRLAMEMMAWAMGGQRDQWDHHGCLLDANILAVYADMAGFSELRLLDPFDAFGLHVMLKKQE